MPHMKELLTTYSMFLRTLFTDDCEHYKMVWEAKRTLQAIGSKASKIPEETWRCLTWCIIDGSRQFFATIVDENDLIGGETPTLPMSLLDTPLANLCLLQPFMPLDFPDQWKTSKRTRTSGIDWTLPGDKGGGGA